MKRRAAAIVPPFLPCLLLGLSCAGSAAFDRRAEGIQVALRAVDANGAMRCAPRELAVARSHIEFAQLEREQGSISSAEAHLDVAEENVRAARVLESSARCSERPGAGTSASPVVSPAAQR
jgi:OmpA-OmpF porin, OOP family